MRTGTAGALLIVMVATSACSRTSSTKVSGVAPVGFEQFAPGLGIEAAIKLAQGDPDLAGAKWTLDGGDRVASDVAAALPAIKERLKEPDASTILTIEPAKAFPQLAVTFGPTGVQSVQVTVSRDESAIAELLASAKAKHGNNYSYVDAIKQHPVMAPLFYASDQYTWVLCDRDIEYIVRWISPKIPQARSQASVEWSIPDAPACGKTAKK